MVRFQSGPDGPKEDTSLKRLSAKGFTLIELLTVIAIISILASMIFIVGPRMIERAKITRWTQTCNEIRTTAVAFYAKKAVGVDTYPPAYGYLKAQVDHNRENEIGQPNQEGKMHDNDFFCMVPYVSQLGYMRNYDVYDPFDMTSHDTDRDGVLSLLEFSLVGEQDSVTKEYSFSEEAKTIRYDGTNQEDETSFQLHGGPGNSPQRPMIYIPVNLAQTKLVAQYYSKLINEKQMVTEGTNALRWDYNDTFADGKNPLNDLRFPPPRYDDFILISAGPGQDTGGIVTPMRAENGRLVDYTSQFLANVNKFDYYHVLALRAYYLATRDLNQNGLLDFDFRNRTRSGEAKPASYSGVGDNLLPNGTNGYGPLIYMPNASVTDLKK